MKNRLPAVGIPALSLSVSAQQPPRADGQRQQIPPPPVRERTPLQMQIDKGNTPLAPSTDNVKITVSRRRVTGAKTFLRTKS
jgi:hypothetical protein